MIISDNQIHLDNDGAIDLLHRFQSNTNLPAGVSALEKLHSLEIVGDKFYKLGNTIAENNMSLMLHIIEKADTITLLRAVNRNDNSGRLLLSSVISSYNQDLL